MSCVKPPLSSVPVCSADCKEAHEVQVEPSNQSCEVSCGRHGQKISIICRWANSDFSMKINKIQFSLPTASPRTTIYTEKLTFRESRSHCGSKNRNRSIKKSPARLWQLKAIWWRHVKCSWPSLTFYIFRLILTANWNPQATCSSWLTSMVSFFLSKMSELSLWKKN